jgi:hypothetical protein
MTENSWDALFAEAEAALEKAAEDPNAELGDEMTPQPEGRFGGRWRGDGTMVTKRHGTIGVYLVWSADGKPGFLYQHGMLVQQVEEQRPQVGDLVVVLRGETREYEKDGEARKSYPYVLRKRKCSDPLPDSSATHELEAGSSEPPTDDDAPF